MSFENLWKEKKNQIILAAVAAVILGLIVFTVFSNQTKPASESTICDDILHHASLNEYDMEIVDYHEEKRDTNKESKYDNIWVDIVAENNELRFTGKYLITYKLYNDGWLFEDIQYMESDYVALEDLNSSQVEEDINSTFGDYIASYSLNDIEFDIQIPDATSELKTVDLACEMSAQNDTMTFRNTFNLQYELKMDPDQCGWTLIESSAGEPNYSAKKGPSTDLITRETSSWQNDFSTVSTKKTGDNSYEYVFLETDESTFAGITVYWERTLDFWFNPKTGWKLHNSTKALEDLKITADGVWKFNEDGENATLKILSVENDKIIFDLDITYIPYSTGSTGAPRTYSGRNIEYTWTYKYNEKADCIIFSSDEHFAVVPNLYHNSYLSISFWAYSNEAKAKDKENEEWDGYHLDVSGIWFLEKVS